MTSNAKEFGLELARFLGEQLPKAALLAHKKVTLEALRGVVLKSPVDTGRFRGNWQVTVDTPTESPIDRFDQQAYGSEPSGAVLSDGISALSNLEPYGVAYVQNNLPYAERLENGWSGQAPQGMVALTVAELQDQIIDDEEAA